MACRDRMMRNMQGDERIERAKARREEYAKNVAEADAEREEAKAKRRRREEKSAEEPLAAVTADEEEETVTETRKSLR